MSSNTSEFTNVTITKDGLESMVRLMRADMTAQLAPVAMIDHIESQIRERSMRDDTNPELVNLELPKPVFYKMVTEGAPIEDPELYSDWLAVQATKHEAIVEELDDPLAVLDRILAQVLAGIPVDPSGRN